MAPRIEARMPGPWSGRYHPAARPRKPAMNEPATPSNIVTMMPPGSFPGIASLARAPTIRPMIKLQSRPMRTPPLPFDSAVEARPRKGRASGYRREAALEIAHVLEVRVEPGAIARVGEAGAQ